MVLLAATAVTLRRLGKLQERWVFVCASARLQTACATGSAHVGPTRVFPLRTPEGAQTVELSAQTGAAPSMLLQRLAEPLQRKRAA